MANTAPAKTEEKTETKAERFVRLGQSRTSKALDAIANIGGLANKGNYEYTEEQANKILKALEAEVVKLSQKFANPGSVVAEGFTL